MRSLKSTLIVTTVLLASLGGIHAADSPEGADEAVALARETLARKMRQDPGDYELVSAEAARIRLAGSRSIPRCEPPSPGEEATAAGWRVRLRLGKDTVDLIVAEGRAQICNVQSGERAAPERRTVERKLAPLTEEAREDLARRLSMPPQSISVLEAVSVVWPDSSAGCPQKGMSYAQVQTPGFRILLTAGGRTYHYHGRDGGPPVLCGRPSGPEPRPAQTS
jgi:hypothetical protein